MKHCLNCNHTFEKNAWIQYGRRCPCCRCIEIKDIKKKEVLNER